MSGGWLGPSHAAAVAQAEIRRASDANLLRREAARDARREVERRALGYSAPAKPQPATRPKPPPPPRPTQRPTRIETPSRAKHEDAHPSGSGPGSRGLSTPGPVTPKREVRVGTGTPAAPPAPGTIPVPADVLDVLLAEYDKGQR